MDDYGEWQAPEGGYGGSQQPDTPYAAKNDKGSNAGAKPPKPALKSPTNGEVTILASFVWKPEIDGATEIKYLLAHNGSWHPGFDDYAEITGVTQTESPSNLPGLLGAIAEYKQGSIKRLNFFTHANTKVVGISGYMDSTGVHWNVPDGDVNEVEIDNNASTGLTFTRKGQSFTLDDVRKRFTADATFVLYGCDIAFDPTTLLTAWKNLFQVTAIGFRTKMVFCPPDQEVDGTVFNRTGEKIGLMKPNFICKTDATRDWRSLVNDPNAVKVSK